MTHSIHPSAKQGFSASAELYQSVRPNYPEQIVAYLKSRLNLSPKAHLLDLGTGTGKFLPYLKQLSHHIIAVDPIAEMLAQLKFAHPDIEAVQGSSDHLSLANESVDAVFCAQSFHWFANIKSLQEIERVLKPDGCLVLIWNQRDTEIDWVKALANEIAPFEGDTPRYHTGLWRKAFDEQDVFTLIHETVMPFVHSGTVEAVVAKRLLSTSFIAKMPTSKQQELKQRFEAIVQNYTAKTPQDLIDFPYQTHVYIFAKMNHLCYTMD